MSRPTTPREDVLVSSPGPDVDLTAVDVSIVVPCHNGATVIGEQLAALCAQGIECAWELIVVDDHSTDVTRQILAEWQARFERMSVISPEIGGSPSAARNAGLAAVRGDFVLFCDADDVVQPGWAAALLAGLERYDLVGGPLAHDALNGGWPPAVNTRRRETALPLSADHLPFAHTGNLGVRHEAAVALRGFDETMITSEDQDFSWRAIQAGLSVGFAPDAVVQVRLPTSIRRLWTQRVSWGIGSVELYVRHRGHMPRPRSAVAFGCDVVRLAVTAPLMVGSRARRFYWIGFAGFLLGRVKGSLKYRTIYL